MVGRVGPLATISGEPRQAWKGAAATTDSGAGMWLARFTTLIYAERYIKRLSRWAVHLSPLNTIHEEPL